MSDDLHARRAVNPVRDGLERTGLYHSMRLPDGRVLEGAMPLSYQEDRWRWFGLPDDLTGRKALDVGCAAVTTRWAAEHQAAGAAE